MKTSNRFGLSLLTIAASITVYAQQPIQRQPTEQQYAKVVSVSAKTTTARVAASDEFVNVNGRAMRVADAVAILSSSTVSEPHLRIPEKQNSADAPHTQPESKMHSD